MGKKKNKIARWLVSVNEPQKKMLDEMMLEDAQTDVSNFFGSVLVNEYKRRQEEKNKRPVGRPRGKVEEPDGGANDEETDEYITDLPKSIYYFGTYVGPKEYADKLEFQKSFKPK